MLYKNIIASKPIPLSSTVVAEQVEKFAESLNKFSNELQSDRLSDIPLLDCGEYNEQVQTFLDANGQSDLILVAEPTSYKVGAIYRTLKNTVVHIDQANHYDSPERAPFFTSLSLERQQELEDAFKASPSHGIDHILFSVMK